MSVSRDDFSIAFRSALLQRGGAQKFSVLSLIFLAFIIFFLDIYVTKFTKPVRGIINDIVYRVTYLASTPTRIIPEAGRNVSSFLNIRESTENFCAPPLWRRAERKAMLKSSLLTDIYSSADKLVLW